MSSTQVYQSHEDGFSQYFIDFWLTLWLCIVLTGPHPLKWKEWQLTNLQSCHSKFCVERRWNITQIFSTVACSQMIQHQWKVTFIKLDSRLVRVRCAIEGGQDWGHCISVQCPDNAEPVSACSVSPVFTRNHGATSFHIKQVVWNRERTLCSFFGKCCEGYLDIFLIFFWGLTLPQTNTKLYFTTLILYSNITVCF